CRNHLPVVIERQMRSAFEGTGAMMPMGRSHGPGTSHSSDQDAEPDRGDPPRGLPTARQDSVRLGNGRSIEKAFVARRTMAQIVAVQPNQIKGVQEQAFVVVAMGTPDRSSQAKVCKCH